MADLIQSLLIKIEGDHSEALASIEQVQKALADIKEVTVKLKPPENIKQISKDISDAMDEIKDVDKSVNLHFWRDTSLRDKILKEIEDMTGEKELRIKVVMDKTEALKHFENVSIESFAMIEQMYRGSSSADKSSKDIEALSDIMSSLKERAGVAGKTLSELAEQGYDIGNEIAIGFDMGYTSITKVTDAMRKLFYANRDIMSMGTTHDLENIRVKDFDKLVGRVYSQWKQERENARLINPTEVDKTYMALNNIKEQLEDVYKVGEKSLVLDIEGDDKLINLSEELKKVKIDIPVTLKTQEFYERLQKVWKYIHQLENREVLIDVKMPSTLGFEKIGKELSAFLSAMEGGLEGKKFTGLVSLINSLTKGAKKVREIEGAMPRGKLGFGKLGEELKEFSKHVKGLNVSRLKEAAEASLVLAKNTNEATKTQIMLKKAIDSEKQKQLAQKTREAATAQKELKKEANATAQDIKKMGKAYTSASQLASKNLQDIRKSMGEVKIEQQKLNAELSRTQLQKFGEAIKANSKTMQTFTKRTETFTAAFGKAGPYIAAATIALQTMGKVASKLFDMLKKGTKVVLSLAKDAFGALTKRLDAVSQKVKLVTKQMETLTKKIGKLGTMMKGVIIYRVLRSALTAFLNSIRDAFENLRIYSADFDRTLRELAASTTQLRNSIGAMLAPVLVALEPIIIRLTAWFVRLMDAVGMFFASITGAKTYTRALRNVAGATGDVASAAGGAAKAVKELNNQLIGSIDELNVLSDSADRAGGGGGGTIGKMPNMFETIDLDERSWKDRIKDAIDKFAEWLKNIDWTKVKQAAYDAGKTLAEILNWIFGNKELMGDIGRSIGELINTAVRFLKGAFDYMNKHNLWKKWGRNFGHMVASIFKAWDWKESAEVVRSGLTGLFRMKTAYWSEIWKERETIGGKIGAFLNDVLSDGKMWGAAGKAFITKWKAIFGNLRAALAEMDPKAIADGILEFFRTIIRDKVAWTEIGKTINDAFVFALTFILEFAKNFPFEELKQRFKDFIGEIDFETIWGLLKEIWETDFAQAIWNGIKAAIIGGALKGKLGAVIMFLVSFLKNDLKEKLPVVADAFDTLMRIFDVVASVVKGLIRFLDRLASNMNTSYFQGSRKMSDGMSGLLNKISGTKDETYKSYDAFTALADILGAIVFGFTIVKNAISIVIFPFQVLYAALERLYHWMDKVVNNPIARTILGLKGASKEASTEVEQLGTTADLTFDNLSVGAETASYSIGTIGTTADLSFGNLSAGAEIVSSSIGTIGDSAWDASDNISDAFGEGFDDTLGDLKHLSGEARDNFNDIGDKATDAANTIETKFGGSTKDTMKNFNKLESDARYNFGGMSKSSAEASNKITTSYKGVENDARYRFGGMSRSAAESSNDISRQFKNTGEVAKNAWGNIESTARTSNQATVEDFRETIKTVHDLFDRLVTNIGKMFKYLRADILQTFDRLGEDIKKAIGPIKIETEIKTPAAASGGGKQPRSLPVMTAMSDAVGDGSMLGIPSLSSIGGANFASPASVSRAAQSNTGGISGNADMARQVATGVAQANQTSDKLLEQAVAFLANIANKDMEVRIGDRDVFRASQRGQRASGFDLYPQGVL